jgi:hypothetical protein
MKSFETCARTRLFILMPQNIAALNLKNLLGSSIPELGPKPRPDALDHDTLTKKLADVFKHSNISTPAQELIRALLLLWHDQLDAAHHVAQAIENADGSFIHGIVHRREPDYSNAGYWFRRVGGHECFPEIAARAKKLLDMESNPAWSAKLLAHGEWEPLAFIQLCASVEEKPSDDPQVLLLRKIQAIETEVLLDHFLH